MISILIVIGGIILLYLGAYIFSEIQKRKINEWVEQIEIKEDKHYLPKEEELREDFTEETNEERGIPSSAVMDEEDEEEI